MGNRIFLLSNIIQFSAISVKVSRIKLFFILCVFSVGCASGPTIKHLDPDEGPRYGGNILFIMGYGIEDDAEIYVGDLRMDKVRVNQLSEAIIDEMPSQKPGVYDVTVVNPDGKKFTLPQSYTYLDAPIIYEIIPNSGPEKGGMVVTVRGDYFKKGAHVKIGKNMSMQVKVHSSRIITAVTASSSPGPSDTIVFNPDGLSYNLADGYTFLPAR